MSDQIEKPIIESHHDRLKSLKKFGNFGIPGRGVILPNESLLSANPNEQFQNAQVLSNIPFSPEPIKQEIKQENNIVKIEGRKVPEGYKEVPIAALPDTTVAEVQKIAKNSILQSIRSFNPNARDNASQLEKTLVGTMYK